MRRQLLIVVSIVVILGLSVLYVTMALPKPKIYRDGVYLGSSQSIYTGESYYGVAQVTIYNHQISKVDFYIIDKSNNEILNEKYEKHFYGNAEYLRQFHNDLKGTRLYPQKLLEVKSISQVDAIAGATWSYNIFKDSVEVALKKAQSK